MRKRSASRPWFGLFTQDCVTSTQGTQETRVTTRCTVCIIILLFLYLALPVAFPLHSLPLFIYSFSYLYIFFLLSLFLHPLITRRKCSETQYITHINLSLACHQMYKVWREGYGEGRKGNIKKEEERKMSWKERDRYAIANIL